MTWSGQFSDSSSFSQGFFRQSKFNEEIGEDVSSEDYKSSVDELIKYGLSYSSLSFYVLF